MAEQTPSTESVLSLFQRLRATSEDEQTIVLMVLNERLVEMRESCLSRAEHLRGFGFGLLADTLRWSDRARVIISIDALTSAFFLVEKIVVRQDLLDIRRHLVDRELAITPER